MVINNIDSVTNMKLLDKLECILVVIDRLIKQLYQISTFKQFIATIDFKLILNKVFCNYYISYEFFSDRNKLFAGTIFDCPISQIFTDEPTGLTQIFKKR